jgi:ribonuclease H2 subunit A
MVYGGCWIPVEEENGVSEGEEEEVEEEEREKVKVKGKGKGKGKKRRRENAWQAAGFADSKVLARETREELFEWLVDAGRGGRLPGDGYVAPTKDGTGDRSSTLPHLGFATVELDAPLISASMTGLPNVNLNTLSHSAAAAIIAHVLYTLKLDVVHVYVDTVGSAAKYADLLRSSFPSLRVTVESKADAKYRVVSAASVVAKVVRDRRMDAVSKSEGRSVGSGYPGDPATKAFVKEATHPLWGYGKVVRFSWKTIETALKHRENRAELLTFLDEADDGSVGTWTRDGAAALASFLGGGGGGGRRGKVAKGLFIRRFEK